MRKVSMGILAALVAIPLGCGQTKEVAKQSTQTVGKAAQTAGTATVESAKTVGGTTRGAVTGGTSGAKEEWQVGTQTTSEKTRERAAETRKAAKDTEKAAE